METKLVEILDGATCIPAMATLIDASDSSDCSEHGLEILGRGGYSGCQRVLLTRLDNNFTTSSPSEWGSRTMAIAHMALMLRMEVWGSTLFVFVLDVGCEVGESGRSRTSELLKLKSERKGGKS